MPDMQLLEIAMRLTFAVILTLTLAAVSV
jgi:endonuclease YncB( thermonuclease family)